MKWLVPIQCLSVTHVVVSAGRDNAREEAMKYWTANYDDPQKAVQTGGMYVPGSATIAGEPRLVDAGDEDAGEEDIHQPEGGSAVSVDSEA